MRQSQPSISDSAGTTSKRFDPTIAVDIAPLIAQKIRRMSIQRIKGRLLKLFPHHAAILTFAAQQHRGNGETTRRSSRILAIEKEQSNDARKRCMRQLSSLSMI